MVPTFHEILLTSTDQVMIAPFDQNTLTRWLGIDYVHVRK